ncbi:MAG TPA: methionyl-tRNA formyltransferase [Thermodesulfovibrionales bacterium]|nr:methionyl-tRNA formyltransferase [Thermodesulfovibrionales bacterium]
MRIIFFGTPDFAVPSLAALADAGENIVSVVTQPDRTKGRGHKLSQPPVKEYALSRGMTVLQPDSIRSAEFHDAASRMLPDMIVVVAFGKILPRAILDLPPKGCINVHASMLPKYRGAAPIQWAIVRGEKTAGVTTMLMDEGLDTGDTLLMESTDILPEDSALTLGARLSGMGARLLMETIRRIKDGSVKPVPQSGEASYAPIIQKEHGRIDWSASALDIHNLTRGMYPWPGAFCFFGLEKITLVKTSVIASSSGVPGTIELISGDELRVSTGKDALSIVELKPAGKPSMSGGAFARGRHIREGMRFERQ